MSSPNRRASLTAYWRTTRRRRVAALVALVAFGIATIIVSSRLLHLVFSQLDVLAYASLFAACWIGAGGALVPVPGVRALSWVMVVQQGAVLDPLVVAAVAAAAMVIGQSSYFFAARAAGHRLATTAPRDAEQAGDGSSGAPAEPMPTEATSRRARTWAAAKEGVSRQVQKHGIVTVFAVTALPTPLTTLTTSTAAASGMRYPIFFGSALSGFLLWCSILALFGQGLVLAVQALLPSR